MHVSTLAKTLFAPSSIALVGASSDPNKHSALPQQHLLSHGYRGRVLPINPTRDTVLGLPAFASIKAVGEPVDHAFVMVPSDRVMAVAEDCANAGVPCMTILSNGFAEAGAEGLARQTKLMALARKANMRILGPNSIGLINLNDRVALSANEILSLPELHEGSLGLISQSGSMLGAVLSRGAARGFGFSKMVSVGNEADISVAEIGEMLIDDPLTDTILLFLETIRNAEAMAAMARRAHAAGKPVIAYRAGRSSVGASLAASHTGALVGHGGLLDAFLDDIGILRVTTLEGLLELAPLARRPRPERKVLRASVVTTTGGGGTLAVDAIARAGVEIVVPSQDVVDRLGEQGIGIERKPLVDLTLAGTNAHTYHKVLKALIEDGGSEIVVAVAGSSSQFRPDRAVAPILQAASDFPDARIITFLAPNATESLQKLAAANVAAFRTAESLADAVTAYANWRVPEPLILPEAEASLTARFADLPGVPSPDAAAEFFAALGVPVISETKLPAAVGEWSSEELDALDYPVVLKVLSPDIQHKTEIGGVVVGLQNADALREAAAGMLDRISKLRPDAVLEGFQVQPLVKPLGEALLGFMRDPAVGPMVTLGLGGVLAEVYGDVVTRVAPVSHATALDMIAEVRGFAPLRGYRGLPQGDLEALATAVVTFSRLAAFGIAEAEINPLMILADGHGVRAVDALLKKSKA